MRHYGPKHGQGSSELGWPERQPQCPFRVIRVWVRPAAAPAMSVMPPKATVGQQNAIDRDGPCVDGSELARRIFTLQAWSVQPCVRPLSAVHMTAGHNALRGSGPGQNLAFNNAVAHVGCADRRIDRLCITC